MWMIVAKIELVADFGPSIQYTHLFMDHFFSGVCEFSTISEGWLREPIWGVIFERSWIKISVAVWPFVALWLWHCGILWHDCRILWQCGLLCRQCHFVAQWHSVALWYSVAMWCILWHCGILWHWYFGICDQFPAGGLGVAFFATGPGLKMYIFLTLESTLL